MPVVPHPPVTREVVSSETPERLANLAYSRLITLMFDGARHDDREARWAYLATLSPGLQMLWSTSSLDGEVFNGGFEQYFYNSAREYVGQALDGLAMIDAVAHHGLVFEATERVRTAVPGIDFRDARWRAAYVAAGDINELDPLTRRYWDVDPMLDLYQVRYITMHPDEFVTD